MNIAQKHSIKYFLLDIIIMVIVMHIFTTLSCDLYKLTGNFACPYLLYLLFTYSLQGKLMKPSIECLHHFNRVILLTHLI